MAVNSDALVLWKDYKFPNGLNISGNEEFEDRVMNSAQKAGIPCFITHETLSYDSISAIIGLGNPDGCMRISKQAEKEGKRGLLRTIAKQAFTSHAGDFIITFSNEGNFTFMQIFKSTSHGALIDALDKSSGNIVRDSWTVIMEDILQAVAESCF